MSDGMVKEAETTEKLAQSKLQSRNESLGKQEFEKELSVMTSSNDSMQRKATSLRHVSSQSSLVAIYTPITRNESLLSRLLIFSSKRKRLPENL